MTDEKLHENETGQMVSSTWSASCSILSPRMTRMRKCKEPGANDKA